MLVRGTGLSLHLFLELRVLLSEGTTLLSFEVSSSGAIALECFLPFLVLHRVCAHLHSCFDHVGRSLFCGLSDLRGPEVFFLVDSLCGYLFRRSDEVTGDGSGHDEIRHSSYPSSVSVLDGLPSTVEAR